jgi:hypothetical protein
MSAPEDRGKEIAVTILLAASSLAEIGFILYLTVKEIFKKTGDSFVLKD